VAAERGVHVIDLALDMALETNLEARFRLAILNTDEATTAELLTHPSTMIGLSDAGAHASQLCDAGAPTDLLGRWVREKGVLSIEEGVRRLTSQAADVFGIRDRGRLAVGRPPTSSSSTRDRRLRQAAPRARLPAGADRLVADATASATVIVNGT
jgi:N-acyl-D-aspartate/D-glutamate deacylase